jgi:hypothetical protein
LPDGQDRIVMASFFRPGSDASVRLEERTWSDERVRSWLAAETVAIRIDGREKRGLVFRHEVLAFPTIVFLEPDGDEIDRIVGYVGPDDLLSVTEQIGRGERLLQWQREALVRKTDDPFARQAHGSRCSEQGLHELALEHFLWCWDHGLEHDPSYVGMRSSWLVWEIAQLAPDHEPALAALNERRSACLDALLSGDIEIDPAVGHARDLAMIDRMLDRQQDTLRAWDDLAALEDDPVRAAARERLFPEAAIAMLEVRRYEDVVRGMGGDPAAYAARLFEQRRDLQDVAAEGLDETTRQQLLQHTVEVAARGYAALLGLGRRDEARALMSRIADFQPTDETFLTLAELAAEHAGDARNEVLDELVDRAKAEEVGPVNGLLIELTIQRHHR